MFYESIPHALMPVQSAADAATKIKAGGIPHFKALVWMHDGVQYYAVSDVHADDSAFAEIAMLMLKDGNYYQVDSISRHPELPHLIELFEGIQTPEGQHRTSKTSLIIGKPQGSETAWFECGCCGESFKGNVQEQLEFGQDAGYGICPRCDQWYK